MLVLNAPAVYENLPHPYHPGYRRHKEAQEQHALGALHDILLSPEDDVPPATCHYTAQPVYTAPPPTTWAHAQPALLQADPSMYADQYAGAFHHTAIASRFAASAADGTHTYRANGVTTGAWPPPLSPPLSSPTFSAAPPQPAALLPCSKHVGKLDEETQRPKLQAPGSACPAAQPHPPPPEPPCGQ